MENDFRDRTTAFLSSLRLINEACLPALLGVLVPHSHADDGPSLFLVALFFVRVTHGCSDVFPNGILYPGPIVQNELRLDSEIPQNADRGMISFLLFFLLPFSLKDESMFSVKARV